MAELASVRRLDSASAVAEEAAALIVRAAEAAIGARGRFIFALSGGRTPELAYRRLAEEGLRHRIAWSDTLILWTDERCVPPDDRGSNYRMAREALLDHVPLPADNILRIRGEDCALAEDQRYERALHRLLGPGGSEGRIDLVLLGVGADGHTASLFPRAPSLAERQRWVLPVVGPEPYPRRITLTLPVINAAREVVVLATGAEKAGVVSRVAKGEGDPMWPILGVRPRDGGPRWLVDRDAWP